MGAVWLRARAELRARWRAAVGLALLIGLAGGFVLAAAAGARRTAAAFPTFLREHPGADLFMPNPSFGPEFGAVVLDPAEVARAPEVEAMSVGRVAISQWGSGFAAADERFGFEVPRWKILEGRPYDPARIDEVVVLHSFAEREGIAVGDVLPYPGTPPPDGPPQCRRVGEGPQIQLEVVGIAVMAGPFFAPVTDDPWTLLLTPAMYDRLPGLAEETGCEFLAFPPTPGMMWVRTAAGETDAFIEGLEERTDGGFVLTEPQRSYDERTEDSLGLQAAALWVLAAVAALAVVLTLSQTISRRIQLSADDHPSLRALGVTRRQLIAGSILGVGVPSAAGAALAVAIASGLSSLLPLGAARLADPSPGPAFDALVLGVGAAGIVATMVLLSALPAWLASRPAHGPAPRRRPSLAGKAAGAGLPAPVVAGLRLALETGRGRTAVPVRTTLAGVGLGLGMLAAALTFAASASHLLETPSAYGLTVDVWIHNDPEGFPFGRHVDEVARHPGIEGVALGTPGNAVLLNGKSVEVLPFRSVAGAVEPRVFEGRFPAAVREILLGTRTAERLGVTLGDTVEARLAEGKFDTARVFTVVGIGEVPAMERVGLGEGAVVTPESVEAMNPLTPAAASGLFVRVREGADLEETVAELKALMGNPELQHFGFEAPTDVVDFGRVDALPVALAVVVGLIAAATLAHVVVTSVRRRRRDIAILKSLGFVRRQARATIAWHALATALVGAVVGIPAGVVLGRLAWGVLIRRVGLLPEPVIPLLGIGLIVPAALVLATVIAALPARAAARTRPALVLRAE